MNIKKVPVCCVIIIMHLTGIKMYAIQDTLKITIRDAEKQFIEKNLLLLAEHYNIDIAKAELMQAKVFDNPSFSASIDIYNPDNKKWFDTSKSTGQYIFSIEQVIRLGGKRNKEIAMANANVQLTEHQLYDLFRTFRFSLNSIFYETYYTLRSLRSFDTQIALLEDLETNYKELNRRGTISLNEVVRIQSLLYSLKSDKLDIQSAFNELQSQLQLLIQDNQTIFIPELTPEEYAFFDPHSFSLSSLVEEAYNNRIDMKITKAELDFQQKNLSLQKAIAIPDLTVGAEYDKRGNFTDNLFSFTLSIDLPFFNRNKGNIKAVRSAIKQKELLVKNKKLEIENEVIKAFSNAMEADKIYRSIDPEFEDTLQSLLQNIIENFRKKNISMLEFTDFYESYRDNIIKINQIQNRKVQTMEELRFATGK